MKYPKVILASAIGLAIVAGLHGCGYSSGTLNKSGVSRLYIPVFKNNTYEPDISVLVTTTIIKNFQTDGSFTITGKEDSEAILRGTISRFQLTPARFRIEDERSVAEYYLTMEVDYSLYRKGEQKPYDSGKVIGQTSFFTGDDLVNDKRQGVSYVSEDVGRKLATRLSESW